MTRNPIVRDVVALAALVLIGVGIPLVLVLRAHAVGVPHNDDWVYMRGADTMYRSGVISMPGHSAAAVGQLLLVQPLLHLSGGNPWAFTAFGLGMTALAIAASYLLARAFLGLAAAVLATVLLIAFPGFERQAASFMTDGPAFALEMVSLLLGVLWFQSGRRAALAGSILVGLIGVTIREFAMIAPAAVLGIALARSRAGARRGVVGAAAITALAVVAVLLAARSSALAGGASQPELSRILGIAPALATLAAVLLPAIILAVVRYLGALHAGELILSAVVVLIAVGVPAVGVLIGNGWTSTGMLGLYPLAGVRQTVISPGLWSVSENLALLAAVLAGALILRWARPVFGGVTTPRALAQRLLDVAEGPVAVLALFIVGYAVAMALAEWRLSVFDRYLYPLVPAGAIVLLRAAGPLRWRERANVPMVAALGWLAISAALIAANSFAYDAARWRAGEAAVAAGYAASSVDAGYEWVGFHASPRPAGAPTGFGPNNYDPALMPAPPCAVVSNSRLTAPGYSLIRDDVATYRQYLLFGAGERLYLYGLADPRCPSPAH